VVDDVIYTMGRTLVFLDVSFNSLVTLGDELGDLYQLKELNLACNMITALPATLGKLNKLMVLKANGNKIQDVPESIGKLKLLKTVHLNENLIQVIPVEICDCARLTVLRLQNNKLSLLPDGLSQLSIEELNVAGNSQLVMVPKPMRDNTLIIMWILGLHYENRMKLLTVTESNMAMLALLNGSREEIEIDKQMLGKLGEKRNELAIERANLHLYLTAKSLSKSASKCTIS
jgi:Leucine-rich repeat (LRR) protein